VYFVVVWVVLWALADLDLIVEVGPGNMVVGFAVGFGVALVVVVGCLAGSSADLTLLR
jgi:hypothetical protein